MYKGLSFILGTLMSLSSCNLKDKEDSPYSFVVYEVDSLRHVEKETTFFDGPPFGYLDSAVVSYPKKRCVEVITPADSSFKVYEKEFIERYPTWIYFCREVDY